MAARTSTAPGNWSTSGTWTGGGAVPGNGDTVTITHDVMADVNQIIGTSPATGGATAVTVNAGGKLTLAAGITFTCRGDIIFNATTFVMSAGSTFKFDASQYPSTPMAQHYLMYWSNHATLSILTVNGTAGSRCTITSDTNGGSGRITKIDQWAPTIRYCTITNLGDASTSSIEMGGGYSKFDLEQVVVDGCGQIDMSHMGATAIVRLVNVTVKNSLATVSINNTGGGAQALTTGVRLMQGCVFDKACLNRWMDWTITDSFVWPGAYGTDPWAAFSGNFIEWSAALADLGLRGDVVDSYCFVNYTATNPHYLQLEATGAVRGCLFEYLGSAANGDCVMPGTPSAPVTITVEHCIGLPNGGGANSGTMTSLLGNAFVSSIQRHNTWFAGGQYCSTIGETYAGYTGMLQQFRDNLCWDTATTPTMGKLTDYSGTILNFVSAANCHHNAGYNLVAGSNGKGYNNLNLSPGSPGANDVDGVNPNFVDPTRNLKLWDASIAGGAGSVAHAITELKKKNEAGYNPAYKISDLITWVKGGFVPTNAAMHAASDNVAPSNGWIGALEGTTPTATLIGVA